jgi:hypothetical protein
VARAREVSRRAITEGLAELSSGVSYVPEKTSEWIRRPGGGRKKAVELDSTLQSDLESLIESLTRGDPQSPLPVDLPKLAPARRATHGARASSQSHFGGRTTASRENRYYQMDRYTGHHSVPADIAA